MSENSAVTERAFLTGARLRMSRLRLDEGLERLYQQVVTISAQALDVKRVGVWFFERDMLRCRALHDDPVTTHLPALPMATLPIYCEAVRSHRFVATTNAQTDPSTKELHNYLVANDITSMLDAAIYRNGVVVGVVCHEHVGPPREWRSEEHQFAATVADLIAGFMESSERMRAEATAHELELRLKDAHRLDALGRLSGGVAHDLNNLLGTISNGLAVLKKAVGTDLEAQHVVHLLEQEAGYAAKLVEQLAALGRGKVSHPKLESLDSLLDSINTLVASQFQPPWTLAIDAKTGLQVWADAVQFRQVFVNLLLNAREAMPKGGTVLLRAHASDGALSVAVIDTGEGIAKEDLDHIFDPYFTTRDRGSGIGLSIVAQVVHQHGGDVSVTSLVGDGTTFHVRWPMREPSARE